jgi:hypothetical protein
VSQLYLRPSAASRWISCPASALLSKDIPETPSGDAAMAGTAIHALAETCYLTGDDPMNSVGKTIEGVPLAAWHCQMAQQHLDEIAKIESEIGSVGLRVEEKVSYIDTPELILRGTADVIGVGKDTLVVADLKTGSGYVNEDNEQMKIYALAAIKTLGLDFIKNVELRVIQPRHGETRTHRMTLKELNQWDAKVLRPAIVAAQDPKQQPKPSEKACQYCPAKLTCPAQREALAVIEAQPNVTAMTKDEIKAVMVRLSDEQISDLLERAPIVESFIESLRKHALERMKDGGSLPGWQLAPKRAVRKWKDEAQAKEALSNLGIPLKDLLNLDLITPAAAEKLLDKEQKAILEELTVKESSGITIARDASLRQ